jgi:hypothetical protein
MATKSRSSHKLEAKSDETALLGAQFRRYREAQRVSLETVAKAVGKTIWCIRRHEAGEMMLRLDEVYAAARAMDVAPVHLTVRERL